MAKTDTRKMQTVAAYGRRVVRSQLIEVIVPANTQGAPKTKILLPDIPNIRNSHIYNLKVFCVSDSPLSITTLTPLVTIDFLKSCFISLQGYNGKLFQSQKPLISLRTNNLGRTFTSALNVFEINPVNYVGQKVNYPKSYIEIADASLISTSVDQSILLELFYSGFAKAEKKARSASFRNQS